MGSGKDQWCGDEEWDQQIQSDHSPDNASAPITAYDGEIPRDK